MSSFFICRHRRHQLCSVPLNDQGTGAKPSRSLTAATSIWASNSPASTARFISSSVGTKSATVAISIELLPLANSSNRSPYRVSFSQRLVVGCRDFLKVLFPIDVNPFLQNVQHQITTTLRKL